MAGIPRWHQEIVEIVCMFEKELPTSFMDLQVHILIHLIDEVELVGDVSCRWMFFLERYMNKLKGFVQQRAKLEGSTEEKKSFQKIFWKKETLCREKEKTFWEEEMEV